MFIYYYRIYIYPQRPELSALCPPQPDSKKKSGKIWLISPIISFLNRIESIIKIKPTVKMMFNVNHLHMKQSYVDFFSWFLSYTWKRIKKMSYMRVSEKHYFYNPLEISRILNSVSMLSWIFNLVSFHLFEKYAVKEHHGWARPVHSGYRIYYKKKLF